MDFQTRTLLNELVLENGITDIINEYTQELDREMVYDTLLNNIDITIKTNKKSVSIVYKYKNFKVSIRKDNYVRDTNEIYLMNQLIREWNDFILMNHLTKSEYLMGERVFNFMNKVFTDLGFTESEINKL